MNEVKKAKGPKLVPGVWLMNVALGLKLSATEWQILGFLLGWPRPLTTRQIAKHLEMEYTHAKRAVRHLMALNVVEWSRG